MRGGLAPGLLRRRQLEQADGFTVGSSSCLGGVTADGAEQRSPQAGIQDLAQQKARALSPKIIQHSMGRDGSDAALPFVLLLLSKKLYLTFPRSRLWMVPHWLATYSTQEPTSPKTKLTVALPWKGTFVLRRALQSPRSSPQRHREVRLEEGRVLEGGEQGEAATRFEREQACGC